MPYIFFKFLGINSFIDTLNDSATPYQLFDDDFLPIFDRRNEILNSEDTIKTGILTKEEQQLFFAEVGIKITKSYRSYFVYIFDHHPTMEEIDEIILGLETLINENLDKVDPSEIANNLKKRGGHTIN